MWLAMPAGRRDGEFGSRAESHPYVCATAQTRGQDAETRPGTVWVCHTVPCHGGTAVTTARVASKLAQIKAGGLEMIS